MAAGRLHPRARDAAVELSARCVGAAVDQEYQAPPFYQGRLGFDLDDLEKPPPGPDGDEPRFAKKYKRLRKINWFGLSVRAGF